MNNKIIRKSIVLFKIIFLLTAKINAQKINQVTGYYKSFSPFIVITYNLLVCKGCRYPLKPYIKKIREVDEHIPIHIIFNKAMDQHFSNHLCNVLDIDTNDLKCSGNDILFYTLNKTSKEDIYFYLFSNNGKLLKKYSASNINKLCNELSSIYTSPFKAYIYSTIDHPRFKNFISQYMYNYVQLQNKFVIWNSTLQHLSVFNTEGKLLNEMYLDKTPYTDINFIGENILTKMLFDEQKNFIARKKELENFPLVEYKDLIKVNDTLFLLCGHINCFKDTIYKKDSVILQSHYPFMLYLNSNLKLIQIIKFKEAPNVILECGGVLVDSLLYLYIYDKHQKKNLISTFKLNKYSDSLIFFQSYSEPNSSAKTNYIPKFIQTNANSVVGIIYYFKKKSAVYILNKKDKSWQKILSLKNHSIHSTNHCFEKNKDWLFGAYYLTKNQHQIYHFNFKHQQLNKMPILEKDSTLQASENDIFFIFDETIYLIKNK